MFLTIGVLVVLSAVIFLYRARAARSVHETNLGRMSPQWIAETRVSKSS